MSGWALGAVGFVVGLVVFVAVFRYAPSVVGGLRWVFVSYGLGAAFILAPAAVTLLLSGTE